MSADAEHRCGFTDRHPLVPPEHEGFEASYPTVDGDRIITLGVHNADRSVYNTPLQALRFATCAKRGKMVCMTARRRPVSDLDVKITAEINRLREARPERPSKTELAVAAGFAPYHGARMLRGEPMQSWTVGDLCAYCAALGTSASAVLAAIGVDLPGQSLEERILADPDITPTDKGVLLGMVGLMRRRP